MKCGGGQCSYMESYQFSDNTCSDDTVLNLDCGGDYTNLNMWQNCTEASK